ncbi:MAG TPA: hypothetical protein VGH89_31150 [Pseudonocardia sp.]|jgi:hypothetical protein
MDDPSNVPGSTTQDSHSWSNLDPLIKFGVALAALLFIGVVIEGALLVPYTLIEHGWTPGR